VIGFKLPNDRIVYDKVSRKDKSRLTEYGIYHMILTPYSL